MAETIAMIVTIISLIILLFVAGIFVTLIVLDIKEHC